MFFVQAPTGAFVFRGQALSRFPGHAIHVRQVEFAREGLKARCKATIATCYLSAAVARQHFGKSRQDWPTSALLEDILEPTGRTLTARSATPLRSKPALTSLRIPFRTPAQGPAKRSSPHLILTDAHEMLLHLNSESTRLTSAGGALPGDGRKGDDPPPTAGGGHLPTPQLLCSASS